MIRKRGSRLFLIVFALFWCASGTAFYLSAEKEAKLAREIAKWPMVPATIVSAEVVEFETPRRETRQQQTRQRRTKAYPRIVYTHEANGRLHTNETAKLNFYEGRGYDYANKMVSRYPAGTKAQVHVNPSDPYETELPGNNRDEGAKRGQLWGLVIALLGVGFLAVALLRRPK